MAVLGLLVAGLLITAAPAAAKPPRTGFEKSPTRGLAQAKTAGAPTVVRARAVEGSKALRLKRSGKPQWVQHRYRPAANRLAVSFSYKRIRTGRQIIFSLPANNIQLADTGTGKLLLMRPKKPARVIARVNRAGSWNRLKVIVDARRNRMRVVPNNRTRTRWQRARFRKEAAVRFGALNLKNGPVFYDAVNLSPDETTTPAPPVAADPAPIGTPPPGPVITPPPPPPPPPRDSTPTVVSTSGSSWMINGRLTYPGTAAQGTLQVVRAANAIFDDTNPATLPYWKYPDTGVWDPERNTNEFIEQMRVWRTYGINAVDVSLMGGKPYPYNGQLEQDFGSAATGSNQPQNAIGFTPQGQLLPAYRARAERVIEAADQLDMIVILTVLYWGQVHRLQDLSYEDDAVRNTALWLKEKGYTNVLLELSNESHDYNAHTLLGVARQAHPGILVGIGMSPVHRFRYNASWWTSADWTCLHGNGREDAEISADIAQARSLSSFPLCINEDSHWRITQPRFNMLNSLGTGNGYYDQVGFQSLPINWSINTNDKLAFFNKVRAVTGGASVN